MIGNEEKYSLARFAHNVTKTLWKPFREGQNKRGFKFEVTTCWSKVRNSLHVKSLSAIFAKAYYISVHHFTLTKQNTKWRGI